MQPRTPPPSGASPPGNSPRVRVRVRVRVRARVSLPLDSPRPFDSVPLGASAHRAHHKPPRVRARVKFKFKFRGVGSLPRHLKGGDLLHVGLGLGLGLGAT